MSRGHDICAPTRLSSPFEGSRAGSVAPASAPETLELCTPDEPKGKLCMQTDYQKTRAVNQCPRVGQVVTLNVFIP